MYGMEIVVTAAAIVFLLLTVRFWLPLALGAALFVIGLIPAAAIVALIYYVNVVKG